MFLGTKLALNGLIIDLINLIILGIYRKIVFFGVDKK
jgi:hypothetical protein